MTDKKKALSKGEFAKIISETCDLGSIKEAEQVISSFTKGLEAALAKGESVSLVGFGNFEVKHRPERQGRNPSTGEAMTIKASNVVNFKVGKALKEAVNK